MAISVSPYSNALRRLIKHAGYTFREVAEETKIPSELSMIGPLASM